MFQSMFQLGLIDQLSHVAVVAAKVNWWRTDTVEVWTLVGATWHWSDLTFIEPSVVKLDYGRCLQSNRAVSLLLCSI